MLGQPRMLTLTMTAARPHSGWVGAGGPRLRGLADALGAGGPRQRGLADVVGQRGPQRPT